MAVHLPRLTYPEVRWERTIPLPGSIDHLLDRHLSRWPDLGRQPRTLLGGGLRTLNVRLGDEVVARLALSPDQDLRKERALLDSVRPRVRVPRVIDGSARLLLLEYVRHEELPATREAGEAVGRTAAAIHSRRFESWGFLDDRLAVAAPSPRAVGAMREHAEQEIVGGAAARLGPLADDIRRVWEEEAPALEASCEPPVLVHADFKPANLKWLPAERAVLVLDWEFAWVGPALFDVGQLFRWEVPEAFAAGFEGAYRAAGGVLPPAWRRIAAAWDLVNLVGLLAAPGDHPRRDEDCLARIRQTLASRG